MLLSFFLMSSCSQFESKPKQEQVLEGKPIIIKTSLTAAYEGYLHFTGDCVVIKSQRGGGGGGVQLPMLDDGVMSDFTANSLVYKGKKYTEGDYIRIGGGIVSNDIDTFRKKHNLKECGGLDIFIPN